MPPSYYYFHALNPPEVKIYGDNFIAIGNGINCLLGCLEQSLFTHENQFIVPIVFLNELGEKKHVFNLDSYFLSFYSVISIHPLFFPSP